MYVCMHAMYNACMYMLNLIHRLHVMGDGCNSAFVWQGQMASPPVLGIQHDLPPGALSQCSVCHDISYGYSTMPAHVEYCKQFGNFLVLAAKHQNAGTLSLVAGLYASDLNTTSSDTVAVGPINGAYWHYVPSKGIGFTNTAEIYLNPADTLSSKCATRLSWEFGWYAGGRVGCGGTDLKDTSWRKMIYTCNVTVSRCKRTYSEVTMARMCGGTALFGHVFAIFCATTGAETCCLPVQIPGPSPMPLVIPVRPFVCSFCTRYS